MTLGVMKESVNDNDNENVVDYFYDDCDERAGAGRGRFGRLTRKNIPEDIKKMKKKCKRGKIIARHSGDVMVLAWKDAKIVSMISNFHDNGSYMG
ncbi:PiggyBac transposable element-derived protein 4 [Eumeta japonica]|uniref:PiggyBac transposable element-derived protein 4 n=1 Tax=Eumeta variegata TaxID=151549 RepID=A0A4C1TWN5_EUMVA|nr:PiggyBac transposable element-derived protein 4 [Eumeta japonica]